MDFLEINKLFIFVLFVLPGLISIKIFNLITPTYKSVPDKIFDALTFSSIIYMLWFIPLLKIYEQGFKYLSIMQYGCLGFLIIFITPIFIALIWKKIRNCNKFKNISSHPTAKPWDYYFSQNKICWIQVIMSDGSRKGGYFGEHSFASGYPEEEQIYIEEEWMINENDGFERPVINTMGTIISMKDVVAIEFYKNGD